MIRGSEYIYQLYGLIALSDLALPELLPLEGFTGEPDLFIRQSTVPENGLPDGRQIGPYLYTDDSQFWLHIPDVARFLVRDGREILYDPAEGIDEDSVRVFLLGSCLGALLFQRGFLVLHGNAIRVGNECVVCVGHSGAGKSTLAAAFLQRGYQVLSDDVCAVNAEGEIIPGFPRIKLWQDVADYLQIDTMGLCRIRPNMDKFNYPLGMQFCKETLPLRHIYILNEHNEDHFEKIVIRGLERFGPIRNNTYRVRYMEGMALKAEHLKLCGMLASQSHLTRISRPRSGFRLNELVDEILRDIEEKSACA